MKHLVAVLLVFSLVFAGTSMVCAETKAGLEIGKVYDVTIVEETENQWTGPLGVAKIGNVLVQVPGAKKGQKYKVKINGVEENPYTDAMEAKFDVVSGPPGGAKGAKGGKSWKGGKGKKSWKGGKK